MSIEQTTPANGFSYRLTRTLDAPVAKVWQAWTSPEKYTQWAYAVAGSVEMDVRPGGVWKATVATPDGGRFPLTGSYLDVVEHRLLVVGMDVPGSSAPVAMTMELDEQADLHTRVVLHQSCDTAEECAAAEQGSTMLLDSLGAFLSR